MEWSPQQEKALRMVAAWLEEPDAPLFYLAGFAGTGKTTLAKHFAEGVDGEVMFGAYTGKAAHVLKQKGCIGAKTIHSMIYKPREKGYSTAKGLSKEIDKLREEMKVIEAGNDLNKEYMLDDLDVRIQEKQKVIDEDAAASKKPQFVLNVESEVRFAKLVVIDECSMVDKQMGEDLMSFGVKILVLGDPAQLPPVGSGGFFTKREPDMLLTEIHRQAQDSPILWLATLVRNGKNMPYGTHGDGKLRVVPANADITKEVMDADQVLVGKNETRHGANQRYRALLGKETPFPTGGDKLVCLRNDHDVGLLNGSLWRVHEAVALPDDMRISMVISSEEEHGQEGIPVDAHLHHFMGKEEDLPYWERKEAQEFDFGYALTVHKSQGSQWDNVVLYDQSWCFRSDRAKWLYTGITRAAEELIIKRL